MFTKSETETKLDAEINSLLDKMKETPKETNEYEKLADRLAQLHQLKTEDRPKRISPDTALIVAANLVGILWLTLYEREHVIGGKAINFLLKPR